MSAWTDHVKRWKNCQACPLCNQRSQVVLARGQVPCDVLFIGEAPGISEDVLGQPFKGPAGKLLDAIIFSALTGPQQQTVRWAFTNLVACYPRDAKTRGDNQPAPAEIKACQQRLVEFVRLAKPRLIVLVGQLAKKWVSGQGMFCELEEGGDCPWLGCVPLEFVEIDHPAFILRSPEVAQGMLVKRAVLRVRNAVQGVFYNDSILAGQKAL